MDIRHKVFFVGIGGISMSGLALYLNKNGFDVSGSDITENVQTKMLKSHGIKVFLGHKKNHIKDAELVVFNSAINEGNEDSDAIKALVKVLKSDDIKKFIDEKYDGAVIAFE